MRPLLLSTALLLSATGPAAAQTLLRVQDTAPYAPLVGGQPLSFLNTNDAQDTLAIGFDLPFQGQVHRFVSVSTNGGVILSNACMATSSCTAGANARCQAGACVYGLPARNPEAVGVPGMPSANLPQSVVAPLWDDLDIDTGTVTYARRGVAPLRSLVIEWRDVRHATGRAGRASVQLVLSEDGTLRMHYGPMAIPSGERWSATAGFEDGAGAVGDVAVACAQSGPCASSDLALLTNTRVTWSVPRVPELIGRAAVVPSGAGPGEAFSLDLEVENLGTATAAMVQVDLHLSADTTVEGSDPRLLRRALGPLYPQQRRTFTLTATVPMVAPRLYTLGAILDPTDLVEEADETNNVVVLQRNFFVGRDLSAQIDTPAPAGPGEPVDITVRLVNRGAATATVAFDVLYSENRTRGASDVLVFSGQQSLPTGTTVERIVTAVLPAIAPGPYFALLDVDPGNQLPETDETNNLGFSRPATTVRGPNLVAVSISTADPFATPGAPLNVQAQIDNRGDGGALGFAYSLHLSDNPTCRAGDPQLLRVDNVDLAAGGSLPILAAPLVPTTVTPAPGYSLCLIVNTAQSPPEETYNDNIQRSQNGLAVTAPRPDFSALGVRTPPVVAAGEAAPVERVLLNQGLAAGRVTYQAFLSEDEVLDDTQDILLSTQSIVLDAGREDVDVEYLVVPSPQPPGRYRVLYVLDPERAIDEPDETNNLAASAPFDLVDSGVRFVTSALPAGTRGAPYAATLVAEGGAGPITFELFEGALPPGVTLDIDGRLSGLPTDEGRFDAVFRARAGAVSTFARLPILVVGPTRSLQIATRALPIATVDLPYAHPLVALGGAPPYTWQLEGGGLPEGLTLDPDGVLSGTPALAAAATLDVTVQDALGATALATFALNVRAADAGLRWSATPLPDGVLGDPYEAELALATGSGGVAPFTVRLVGGALPPGLALEGSVVSGTPTELGRFAFDLQIDDAQGDWDRLRFVVEIASGQDVTFFDNAVPDAVVGVPYAEVTGEPVQLRATPVGETEFSIDAGALPPGLTLAPDGRLDGTPTEPGVFSFIVRAATPTEAALAAFGIEVRADAEPPAPLPMGEAGCRGAPTGSAAGLLLVGLLGLLRRRRGATAAAFFLAPSLAAAQTDSGYGVTSVDAPYPTQSGTPTPFVGGPDNGEVQVILPFSFAYFEGTFDRVQVGSNGLLVFGGDRAIDFQARPIPNADTVDGVLAPWWDDLTTGRLEVAELGPPGQRVMVFDFSQVQLRDRPAAGTLRFQVRLYEGRQGRFDVCYGANVGSTNGALFGASAGFEDVTGARGEALLSCGASCEGADFTRATDTCVVARRDLGPDLSAVAVTGPDRAVAGLAVTGEVRVDSLSSAPLGPFVSELSLVGPSPSPARQAIGRSPPISVPGFARATIPITGALPANLLPGLYRFAAEVDADDDLAEPDESDNAILALGQILVLEPRADLEASSVTRDRATAAPGDSLRVTALVQNAGSLAAEAAWRLVVSPNPVASPMDRALSSGSAPLAPGSSRAIDEVVTLPGDLPPGRHWIGVVVDPDDAVDELDELDNGAVSIPFDVTGGPATVITTDLAPARVDLPYRQALAAAGGDGRYAWGLVDGALPSGLSLDPAGEIHGTPRAVATASFTVEVRSAGTTGTAALELTVEEAAGGLAIVTRNLLPATLGRAYPDDAPGLTAVGAMGAATFTLDDDAPPGLSLRADGRLLGVPSAAGDFTLAVRVADDVAEATRRVGLTVTEPGRLTLIADLLPPARLGQMYQQPLRALGPTGGATVAFSAADAPPGLQVSRAGLLVGTPSRLGRYTFAVSVEAGAQRDEALFTLDVEGDDDATLRTDGFPRGRVGVPYSAFVEALGLGDPQWSWEPTRLPDDVRAQPQVVGGGRRLVLGGTPSRAGKFSFLLVATDDAGRRAVGGYTIVIDPAPTPETEDGEAMAGCRAGRASDATAVIATLGLLLAGRRRRVARAG